ncbi:MAG: glycosyltransferase family 1 protein [Chloroflexi bacterium]|nr:MAG: glycosyltransferase family 1 protein [Chloroflexota bacterium]
MHILICAVSSSRQPAGICRHAANLARSLAGRREVSTTTLLVGNWQAQYFKEAFELNNSKLRMVTVDVSDGAIARNIWYLRQLPSVARVYKPDVVHLSFPIPFNPHRFSNPVVTSLHDLYPYDIPGNFGLSRVLFNRMFLRQCLGCSAAVVCSSEFTLERLRVLLPHIASTKAVRIYQSVDFGSLRKQEPTIPAIAGRPYLLTVAQHRRNKNLELLLRGFADLRARGGQWEGMGLLIVGGSGPETGRLKRIVRQLSLQGRVVFRAGVTDPELSWLYANCEMLIAPSSIEGFGLPVVEALQCGARVLCSDIPVFREIAGNAAQYFDLCCSLPAKTLADAAIVTCQECAKQPEGLDRFSPEAIAHQYVLLYSKLLATDEPCIDKQQIIAVDQAIPDGRFPC